MLTPARVAISSRRSPGVRRCPPPGSRPTSAGRMLCRRARRNRPSSVVACSVMHPLCAAARAAGRPCHSPARHTRSAAHRKSAVCPAGARDGRLGRMTDSLETRPAGVSQDRCPEKRSSGLVLTAALLGFAMINLDATAVNVALPAIGRSFGGATPGLQWVVDGYTVPFAALLISAGAVSDRLGARQLFGGGLVVFAVASAACGLAPGLAVLVAARAVQGGAAAVMVPSSLALVRQAYADPA